MKVYTWHIHIKGQVQGVGFRPFVYQKAQQFCLKGWVNNAVDGVHCEFNAENDVAQKFYNSIVNSAPSLSDITDHELKKCMSKSFNEFRIIHSDSTGKTNLLLTPDFAMCDDCRAELFTESNRRKGYPFITCTNCGPRYSIIKKLPYDRETTAMKEFTMCNHCQTEYEDPLDRRYYSQTNSCEMCGISIALYDAKKKLLTSEAEEVIPKINEVWTEGKIVALKGIGGYLLTCDAANKEAIHTLRERKHRPAKPFALMYPDIGILEKDVILGDEEKQMLGNAISPIMLVNVREHPASGICLPEIAPGFPRLGVMISYTPLYALLLQSFDKPIIATSGNISHSPIVYSDDKALEELTPIADFVLANNREIVVPQDDSVITFSPGHRQKIVYRRSRGLAPTYINPDLLLPDDTILAAGAMLKSTFTYLHQQNVFISQYLGDLDDFDTVQNYRHTVDHFFRLFDDQPAIILADKHPDYFSTRFAEELANDLNIQIKKYQHHVAHFASILGEHALLDADEPILGVMWDGTGLGDDGQIWGGEFFLYEDCTFTRCGHFDYFNFIAGDKMPNEPRISALAATQKIEEAKNILREKFSEPEWKNYHILLQKPGNLKTSSVGRLFDAVSSLLGLKDRSNYEGEAAMLLEAKARKYVAWAGPSISKSYFSDSSVNGIPTQQLIRQVIRDLQEEVPEGEIAARFHYSLVKIIEKKIRQTGVKKIAFSGGVFQNTLLVDLIVHHIGNDYELVFHRKLSPNDENISFGQLICYLTELRK